MRDPAVFPADEDEFIEMDPELPPFGTSHVSRRTGERAAGGIWRRHVGACCRLPWRAGLDVRVSVGRLRCVLELRRPWPCRLRTPSTRPPLPRPPPVRSPASPPAHPAISAVWHSLGAAGGHVL